MNKINNLVLKRVGILLFLIALQLLYFPINQNVQGGITTYLPIDTHITLSPIWVIPYLLSILWWAGALIWAASKMEYIRFVRFSLCLTLTIIISYAVYILFPTYVDRPKIVDQDFLSQLVMFIYGNDRPYNALPSGHTYTTLIISIFWYYWLPKQRYLWIGIVILVILSTLFTKQHAVLDLITASILAFTCYKISGYLVKKAPED
jgi:membrane-associated phospholipid phosphatase